MVANNRLASNHFHSVKNFLYSSAKPRDFNGMLGTGLPLSMYTRKTPIDKWRLNVTQLFSIFCKIQISIKLFYLYQRLQCTDNYFFQNKFVLFIYLLLSALSKENDMTLYFSAIKETVVYRTTVFTHPFFWRLHIAVRLFRIMSIPTTFHLFRVLTSEFLSRRYRCIRYYCDNVSIS